MAVSASIGLLAQTACLWEVTARKAGDVNPEHAFDTLRYADFVLSAAAIAPVVETAPHRGIGETVLEAVETMRRVVPGNPHLGTILLLVPLAAAADPKDRLTELDLVDSRAVYEAVRLAQPSGLGSVPQQDIAEPPSLPLREIMSLAVERDLIARQYANGFSDVFGHGVPALQQGIKRTGTLEGAILFCQLTWLVNHPDSLIARKLGLAEAADASRQARDILDKRWPDGDAGWAAWKQLDDWMRSKRGRNPGTTADLVCASLFVALRTGILSLPTSLPWTCPGWNAWLNASRSV